MKRMLVVAMAVVLAGLRSGSGAEAGIEAGAAGAPEPRPDRVDVARARAAQAMLDIAWPVTWKVFGPIPSARLNEHNIGGSQVKSVPEKMAFGRDANYEGRAFTATNGHLSLLALLPEAVREMNSEWGKRHAAYCFAQIHCATGGVLYVNAIETRWSCWFLDGVRVRETLSRSCFGPVGSLADNGFAVKLTAGRHTVAVLVESGWQGWGFAAIAGFAPEGIAVPRAFSVAAPRGPGLPDDARRRVLETPLEPVPPVVETEAQRLATAARAPDRFAAHRPRFRVSDAREPGPNEKRQVMGSHTIHDGDNAVLSFRPHAGYIGVTVSNLDPLQPWNPDRHDPVGGGAKRSCFLLLAPFFHSDEPCETVWSWAAAPDGQSVTLCREELPTVPFENAWTLRRTRATLRVDSRCGYVLDAVTEFEAPDTPRYLWTMRRLPSGRHRGFAAADGTEGFEYCNVMPSHCIRYSTPGTFRWRYERTFYTPRDADTFVGWLNDTREATDSDRNGLLMRDDGFIAFAHDPGGWSQVLAHRSPNALDFRNATCWKLLDQHNNVAVPRPSTDGPYRVSISYRYLNLPPEATAFVLDRIAMMSFGTPVVAVRQGAAQDFENDAHPVMCAAPWMTNGAEKVVVTEERARSGRRSALLRHAADTRGQLNRATQNARIRLDPLPVLERRTRYELEAWVTVGGAEAKAWLVVDPPVWLNDHADKAIPVRPSDKAEAGDGWQRLAVTFETPEQYGRSPRLYVWASFGNAPGTVHIDDVRLVSLAGSAEGR